MCIFKPFCKTGTQLYVLGSEDSREELEDEVMKDMSDILRSVDKSEDGVCVQVIYIYVCREKNQENKGTRAEMQSWFAGLLDFEYTYMYMQASTLGSMEALLVFLRSPAVKIPVSGIALGPIHKKDILKASTMAERGKKEYAVILAFDVPVSKEADQIAKENGVTIFKADIIYHLFDMFTEYMDKVILTHLIRPVPMSLFLPFRACTHVRQKKTY